ncbi:hypothetical protein HK405_004593 [Cladochytrium tenue]|nr:hypothetical protein HK405_004593 [Cladochytrium tenue]
MAQAALATSSAASSIPTLTVPIAAAVGSALSSSSGGSSFFVTAVTSAAAAATASTSATAVADDDEDACAAVSGPSFSVDSDYYRVLSALWGVTVVFTFAAICLSLYLCNNDGLYAYCCEMVPIYAICSCLSFRFYWLSSYIDLVRDCYEAFVVFGFFVLLQQYLGDSLAAQHRFMQRIHVPSQANSPAFPRRRPWRKLAGDGAGAAADATTSTTPDSEKEANDAVGASRAASHQRLHSDTKGGARSRSHTLLAEGGDPHAAVASDTAARPPRMTYPFPLCFLTFNPRGQAFLINTRACILQYVAVRPLTTVAAFAMASAGVLCPKSMSPVYGEFWIYFINLTSVSVAMYALILFYIVIHHEIAERKPFWKFVAVKFVVFFSFWQAIVLDVLDRAGALPSTTSLSADSTSELIQSFLVCTEMLAATFIHMYAFPAQDYAQLLIKVSTSPEKGDGCGDGSLGKPTQPTTATAGGGTAELRTRLWPAVADVLSPMDLLRDFGEAPRSIREHQRRTAEKRRRRRMDGLLEADGAFDGAVERTAVADADGERSVYGSRSVLQRSLAASREFFAHDGSGDHASSEPGDASAAFTEGNDNQFSIV